MAFLFNSSFLGGYPSNVGKANGTRVFPKSKDSCNLFFLAAFIFKSLYFMRNLGMILKFFLVD